MERKKINEKDKLLTGFTLIEIIVAMAVIAVMFGVVLFSIQQYGNLSKDSNIAGNMSSLVPAGEVFYNANNYSYNKDGVDFCNPQQNSMLKNAIAQMPKNEGSECYNGNGDSTVWTSISNIAGICCYSVSDAWVAYVKQFTDTDDIFCVDSRGVRKNTSGDSGNRVNIQTEHKCL